MSADFPGALAERMGRLGSESAFQILAKAKRLEGEGRRIVHMEIGQPDFPTADFIIEAAHRAMREGYTGYTPTPGIPQVRAAIADYAARHKGIKTSADEVVIVPGGKPVLFFTMLMLIQPGDEVVYPNPSFPIYESCIRFAGGVPVPVPLRVENGHRIDMDEFRGSLSARTKLVILNNPSNPTGSVEGEQTIREIARALEDFPGAFVLSDEIYDRIVYEGGVTSIASIPSMKDRTIILDGFSKTYAMTGWRLGYGIMHPELARAMELLIVNSNSCAAAFTQMAAMAALTGPQDAVDGMVAAFRARRDWLVSALSGIPGIRCPMPSGAFYVFPDISSFGLSSADFAERLLTEAGVAAASGTSFGAYGEGCIRLSYAASMEDIRLAAERIRTFVAGL